MEMFARDDHVAQWETALLPLRGAARLPALVALAWHVRQRDSARAAALAAEALELLPRAALAAPQRRAVAARLLLVQAETTWLHGALDDAEARAREAGAVLCELGDGAGDAPLRFAIERLALAVVDVLDRRGQADAAVVARQQFRLFHLLDVAPHRLRRHVQLLRQLLDGYRHFLAYRFE